ncbi:MAG: hypothetical protein IIU55_09180 [Paludibacteraceae bacterium]|nr:hypothetical protein [Paludibacteraceae bacterium]
MKKLFSLCLICLLAMSAMAQRAAVMEFKAGVGISQADVDGLSGIFTTYFRPAGYTMIERTQIDRIINEQQMQRSTLTESQMVRIGELLNLSKIVIGDVNIVMGQYNVDVRVINVESGTIAATEGATFAGASYRETMKSLAQKLAGQIAIGAGPAVGGTPVQESKYVDLGLPSGTLWKSKNEKGIYYTYDEAVSQFGDKLPTREQFAELQAFCTWTWNGKGYVVKGDNGNSIVLQAAGYRDCDGGVGRVGTYGYYWSSTPYDSGYMWDLRFGSGDVGMCSSDDRCYGRSVRLVQ